MTNIFQDLPINSEQTQERTAKLVRSIINQLGYTIVDEDINRPWGGYFRFDEKYSPSFKQQFFPNTTLPSWVQDLPFSPKILFTAPHKRLSWQYHNYRGEIWKIIKGNALIFSDPTDVQPAQPIQVEQGKIFEVPLHQRHRLCANDTWVIWAEMWIHTNPNHPSEESDNIRVSDDFGRQSE